MEQYRNWKVNLVLLMKDKVESDTQIDLINTVTDVTRVTVNREGYLEEDVGVAAYDILGNTGGKDYTIRVYATLKDVTRIGEMIHDNTTQAGLLNIMGYEIDLDRNDLAGFNLSGGYPVVNPDNTVLPVDFCREADYTIRLQDEFGNPLCARIGTLPEIILEPGPTTIYRGWLWVEPGYRAQDAEDGDLTEHVLVESSLNVNVLGTYVIRYTVTDTDSQTVTVTRTINVVVPDLVPVLTLLPNASGSISPINIIEGDEFIDPGVLAQDAEDGDISGQVVVTGDVLNNIPGSYIITYTITDSANNVNHMDRVVNVLANTMPVITLHVGDAGIVTPIVIPAGHAYVEPGYTAYDNEDGDITNAVVVSGDTVDTSVEGNYTVNYTVTDNNGGTSTTFRVVQVISNTLPTITLLPDARGDSAVLVLQLGHIWVDPGYTASDIEDGDISNQVLINGTVDTSLLGPNNITYTVTDTAGNTVNKVRTVNIIDPILELTLTPDENNRTSPIYVLETNDSSTIVDPGVSASVTISGVTTDATDTVVITRDIPTVLLAGDSGTITYTLVDQYGMNSTSIVRVVKAAALPIITLLAPTGQVATPIVAIEDTGLVVPGATAKDYMLQDITGDIIVSGDTVDNTEPGSYTVVYTVTDALGLTATTNRIVNILPNNVPSITLLPTSGGELTPLNIPYGVAYTDPGATAYDPEDGDVTSSIVVTNPVDVNNSGSYQITYSITDSSGVTVLATRTIVVAENTGPTITLAEGSPYEIVENIPWVEPGYVALDNEQGNITASVIISGDAVDTTVIGTYTLLYTVVDAGGLTATATRVVNVIVNTAPVITLSGADPYKRLVGPTWIEPGYLATDFEDGDISAGVVITGSVDTTTIGQYNLSYAVTDTSNTTTTVIRQIYILSDADLAIAMRNPQVGPPASPMEWNLGTTWVDPGADVYNPEGETINQYLITTGTVDTSVVGENTITYTATDNYGRSDTVTRTVNVVLVNLEPALGLSGGMVVEWVRDTPWVDPGYTAYDVEDGDITANVVVTGADFDVTVEGTNYINYAVTDSGGKSVNVTRTVIVVPPNVAPYITVIGGDIVIPNSPNDFQDPGFVANDPEDGDITSYVVVGGDIVNRSINGTYVITYDVTDSGGLSAHAERTVIVTADLVPTITLTGSVVNLLVNEVYVEPGYTAYDNEDGDLTGSVFVDNGGLDTSVVGEYTITYTVTDSVGHTTAVTRTVNVVATDTPPVITLLGDNPQHMDQYTTYIERGYYATDVIDGNITNQVVITSDLDTDVFGTYTRTYTVTDSGGNTTTVDRTVIVDFVNKLPVLTLTNGSNMYWPNGLAWLDPGFSAIDTEDGDITANVIIGGDIVDTSTNGSYNITYIITDSNDGTVSKTRTVNVVPNTPPTITLIEHPDDLGDAYHITLIQGHIWEDPGATAYDAQQGDLTSSIIVGGDTIDVDVPDTYNITYTVVDNMGVSVTATRVVTYTPNNVPNIILTAWVGQADAYNITLPWGTPWIEPGYVGTDTEDGIITDQVVISGDNPPDTENAGIYVITYSLTDSYNQTRTVNRNVIILQNQTPSITLEAPDAGHGTSTSMWVYTNSTFTDPGYSAIDPEDGDITADVIVGGQTVDTTTEGIYTITYTVTDSFGNTNTIARQVEVLANNPPVVTLLGDNPQYILQNASNVVDPGATASDIEDGDITANIVADAYPDSSILGTSSVNYSVTDSQGLVGNALRTVTVTEDVALTISVLGANPIEVENDGTAYIDPGASCMTPDNVDISSEIVTDISNVDTSTVGTYTVNYTVTDYVGRTGSATRTVNVVIVNHPPVITLNYPNYTLPVNATYVEQGAVATDDIDGDITASVIIDASAVDMTVPGTYGVIYSVTDTGGLSDTVTRNFVVYANTAPTVTIIGDIVISQTVGGTYTDAGATATDAESGDMTAAIVVSGDTVDPNVVGDYFINYTVTDEGGLGDSKTRVVHILADTPPVITVTDGTPYYVQIGTSYVEPGATAIDNEDGDVTANIVISGDTVDPNTLGDYTVTYTVTDNYGNTSTTDRVVSVVNPPSITLTEDIGGQTDPTYGAIDDHNYVTPGATAVDSFGVAASPTLETTVDPTTLGTYQETFTYTDPVTNLTATAVRGVNIVQSLLPTITILGNNPFSQDEDLAYTDAGATASDPLVGDITANITTVNNLDINTPGTYTYTYSVTGTYTDIVSEVRNITIVSTNTVPTLTLLGANPFFWEKDISPYVDPGATGSDAEDGDITASIVVNLGGLDTAIAGDYTITYDVTDSYGDAATQISRLTKVVNKPTINLLPDTEGFTDTVYLELNAVPSWSAEAVDYLGDVDPALPTIVSTLDASVEGDYTETLDYTDHLSGIDAVQKVRTIHVVATLNPTMILLGDAQETVVEGYPWVDAGVTATDPIDGDVSAQVIVTNPPDVTIVGSYTVTYTYTNTYNRTVTVERIVDVVANAGPVITLIGDNPTTIAENSSLTQVDFAGSNGYLQNESNYDVTIVNANSVILPAQGSADSTGAVAVQMITPEYTGQEHYIDVTFTRDDTGFSYFDQDHTDGSLEIGFYFGATPEAVPSRGGSSWTYGTRTGVVEVDIPPNPDTPLRALDHLWTDGENISISKTVADVVNDAWPTWDSSSIWRIRLLIVDSTNYEIMVWVNGILAKHHTALITGTGYDPMVDVIKAITFKHHSYNSTGHETLRNISIETSVEAIYTEQGATALDDVDGDVTANIVIGGDTVNTSVPGTYTISYQVADSDGLSTTEYRDVIVGTRNYIPAITLLPDLKGVTTPSSLLEGQGEIVVQAIGTSVDWWNKYMQTNILLNGDFEVSYKCNGTSTWIIADTDLNRTEWLSNPSGFGTDGANQTVNHLGDWYTQVLPSGATSALGCIVGLRRVGAMMSSFLRAADGTETTVDTACSTGDMKLYLWQKGDGLRNTKGLLVNGNPITDISAWTTSISTDWDMTATKTWYDRGVTVTDPEDGDITNDVVVSGDIVNLDTTGTYNVVYTITDSDNNVKTVTREVNILENTAPVITLLPTAFDETDNVTVPIGYPWVDPGATAVDNEDGDLTANIILGGDTVDTSTLGIYNITYTVMDVVGVTTTVTRVLNIVPNRPPVITLIGDDPMVIEVGGTYTDPGATAYDPDTGDITASIVVGGDTVDPNTIGDYDVTYDVTDIDGEAADTQIRRVEIVAVGSIQNISSTETVTAVDATTVPQDATVIASPSTTSDIVDSDPTVTTLVITDAS